MLNWLTMSRKWITRVIRVCVTWYKENFSPSPSKPDPFPPPEEWPAIWSAGRNNTSRPVERKTWGDFFRSSDLSFFSRLNMACSESIAERFRWKFVERRRLSPISEEVRFWQLPGRLLRRKDDFSFPRPLPDKRLPFDWRRLSSRMALSIYMLANPFYIWSATSLSLVAVTSIWLRWIWWRDAKVMSLEGRFFSAGIVVVAASLILVALLEGYRLYATWTQLRRVLLALNRTPLRNVFQRIKPLPPASLWSVSTNVHRIQFRLFSQQKDALRRILLHHVPDSSDLILKNTAGAAQLFENRSRSELKKGMAAYWWMPIRLPGSHNPMTIRELLRDSTGYIIGLLIKYWESSSQSIYEKSESSADKDLAREAAEEFVCVHYMAFVHIITSRMRTMTMIMGLVFATVCFALATYPFTPYQYIRYILFVVFVVMAVIVASVYMSMERNEVLSMMTDTTPGALGRGFWLKYATFLIGPVVGIFAAQYPELIDILLSWLQPGLGLTK